MEELGAGPSTVLLPHRRPEAADPDVGPTATVAAVVAEGEEPRRTAGGVDADGIDAGARNDSHAPQSRGSGAKHGQGVVAHLRYRRGTGGDQLPLGQANLFGDVEVGEVVDGC